MEKERLIEWLEKKYAEDGPDEAMYRDLKYYVETTTSVVKETKQGTELMRFFGRPWADQSDPQRIELLRACVRLPALALASGQEYFLQQVVEKLSPEGK